MGKAAANVILEKKVIVICRRIYGESLLRLTDALINGGIRLIEVTFDQADPDSLNKTSQAIKTLKQTFGEKLHVGAGTVLSAQQVVAAQQAGAEYIISPNVDKKVILTSKDVGLLSIPGAMTPSEILTANNAGADFVKLFPAGYLGDRYIKDILAPISHVRLIATGGVNETNFPGYLELGFSGVGVAGRLADKKLIEQDDFGELTRRAKLFTGIVEKEE